MITLTESFYHNVDFHLFENIEKNATFVKNTILSVEKFSNLDKGVAIQEFLHTASVI